jgi:Ras-related protein Rab-28
MKKGASIWQTIGCDFYEKRVVLRGDLAVKLQVWDIGGQSISSKMLPKYILNSHMIYLCYDVTDPQSFADLVSPSPWKPCA